MRHCGIVVLVKGLAIPCGLRLALTQLGDSEPVNTKLLVYKALLTFDDAGQFWVFFELTALFSTYNGVHCGVKNALSAQKIPKNCLDRQMSVDLHLKLTHLA